MTGCALELKYITHQLTVGQALRLYPVLWHGTKEQTVAEIYESGFVILGGDWENRGANFHPRPIHFCPEDKRPIEKDEAGAPKPRPSCKLQGHRSNNEGVNLVFFMRDLVRYFTDGEIDVSDPGELSFEQSMTYIPLFAPIAGALLTNNKLPFPIIRKIQSNDHLCMDLYNRGTERLVGEEGEALI